MAREYKIVTDGKYNVGVKKIMFKESTNGHLIVSMWFKILEGEFVNSVLFVDNIIDNEVGLDICNKRLAVLGLELITLPTTDAEKAVLAYALDKVDVSTVHSKVLTMYEKNGYKRYYIE